MSDFRYLFGPVPSRRFGRSLGIDLLPLKTCTQDCAFCEVGLTTNCTLQRKEYAPVPAVLDELESWYARKEPADFITLAGSGEPTLHSRFGEILDFIAAKHTARSALLTNSTLLFLPEVRRDAARADVVKATLSAWDQQSFVAISRPHPDLRFEWILDGLRRLRAEYNGAIWLEVFIVPGINAAKAQIRKIAALAQSIQPNRIQLNTALRPTADPHVLAIDEATLQELALLFSPAAEVIARFSPANQAMARTDPAAIVALLKRRPCTLLDIAQVFALTEAEAQLLLNQLSSSGQVHTEMRAGKVFYRGRHRIK